MPFEFPSYCAGGFKVDLHKGCLTLCLFGATAFFLPFFFFLPPSTLESSFIKLWNTWILKYPVCLLDTSWKDVHVVTDLRISVRLTSPFRWKTSLPALLWPHALFLPCKETPTQQEASSNLALMLELTIVTGSCSLFSHVGWRDCV